MKPDHILRSARAIENLRNAVDFLDRCRKDKASTETGALGDAHDWLEDAARKVIEATSP